MQSLKEFLESYEGFDLENGELVLIENTWVHIYSKRTMYQMSARLLNKSVYNWTHTFKTMGIILKDESE